MVLGSAARSVDLITGEAVAVRKVKGKPSISRPGTLGDRNAGRAHQGITAREDDSFGCLQIVKETKKAFEFTCELQGCGYRQTGWMTDVITCKRCQARCKVVLGDSGDPLSRMRLGDLRRLGMPR